MFISKILRQVIGEFVLHMDMEYTKKRFGWHLAALGLGIAAVGAVFIAKGMKEENKGCCWHH
jgi:hypothetical protein